MKRLLILLVFLSIGGAIVYFALHKDTSLAQFQKETPLRIGYSMEPPYAFLDQKGEVTGLSPTVAKQIAARLGIKNIEWKLYEFGSLISALEADEIDIIATGMFITKERAKRIAFSEPTFKVTNGLLVLKGNPKKLHSYEQAFTVEGVKIAVLNGSIENGMLEEIGFDKTNLIVVPDVATGKAVVESGLADALALSSPTLVWLEKDAQSEKVALATPFTQPKMCAHNRKVGYGAVMFRKDDEALQEAWNKELLYYIGSTAHIAVLHSFGFSKNALPGKITTVEILN